MDTDAEVNVADEEQKDENNLVNVVATRTDPDESRN